MTIIQAALLGIVEGITEFLPVSSTAHLILSSRILGIPTSDFLKTFEIVIQLGAILAVALLYRNIFLKHWEINKRVLVAFLPTAVIGATLYPFIKELLGSTAVASISLFIGGILLIIFEKLHTEAPEDAGELGTLSYKQAITIGFAQSVAMIPGVSRSAATIVGGMLAGLRRETIVEFSFLLAVPTMAAATGLDLLKSSGGLTTGEINLLFIGFFSAFTSALFAVTWLLGYVKNHTFTAFGIYRIIAALLFWLVI
jgi:undecaprenyl-diphosphatase